VHNASWYHGTDADSASDILNNGLNRDHMRDIINPDRSPGLYVSDSKSVAREYARTRGGSNPGRIIKFSDIDDLLIGDGTTKNNEAVIPFDVFDQIKSNMMEEVF
jgi:hypothetical protein